MTYDPAFTNTASCRSAITYIDGDKGELEYRGYPIEQLAEKSTYLEVAYLLMFGELPTSAQLAGWENGILKHTLLHENIKHLMRGFRYDAHPMGVFLSTVGRALDVLPRRQERQRRRGPPRAHQATDRQVADDRRLRLSPQQGPVLRLPGQQPHLRRQLPEHAVQDDRGQVRGESGARAGARHPVHPARRPRAELRHQRDAGDRQLRGRSLLRDGRCRGRALRTAARRRQRGRADDAAGDRQQGQRPGLHRQGEEAAKAA